MAWDVWLAFCVASAVMLVIPGPTALLVMSYALNHGRSSALAIAGGVVLGDFLAMSLSLLGVGALLMTSALLFNVVKWAGAAYLVWLGIKLWRASVDPEQTGRASSSRMFAHAFAVTALNPKSIAFFVAFLPQFLDPSKSLLPQAIVIEASFLTLSGLNVLFYAVVASKARAAVTSVPALRTFNRIGGSVLVAAGIATAMARKTV